MERELSRHSIVLVGAWTPAVFSPEWLTAHLGFPEETAFDVPLLGPSLPIMIHGPEAVISVQAEKLAITPKTLAAEHLDAGRALAVRLLDLLPHTPLQALGINFGFTTKPAGDDTLAVFRGLADTALLADELQGPILESVVHRAFTLKNCLLNFKLIQKDSGEVKLDFNFHFTPITATSAAERIRAAAELENTAHSVISRVYHEQLNEPDPA